MDKWNRELLDKYCREYEVGIVGFFPATEQRLVNARLKGFPLSVTTGVQLKVCICALIYLFDCAVISSDSNGQ